MTGTRRFQVVFAIVVLLVAGVLSYVASSQPDGLDSATLRGCDGAAGSCIAQSATEHCLSGSPLADYTINGNGSTTGIAGVIGVLATLVVAGGVFWSIARSRRRE